MLRKIKSILFIMGVVMVFTAQTNRPDDKGQQHAPAGKPAARPAPTARPAPAAHNNQSRPQAQTRQQVQPQRAAPQQAFHEAPQQVRIQSQPYQQERQETRVYAVPAPAPVQNNNRLFNRQHHNKWQPRYSFYGNQYHFYPYVNIASTVELAADCVSVGLDGQTYFYFQGTFYQQDAQGQYFAVAPPIGIIVNALPANARQINVDGQIYYRYKGVFFVQVAQGFQVIGPVQPVSDGS